MQYSKKMRKVTISIDEQTYCRARILAAERGTSLSALVRSYLQSLGSGDTEAHRARLRRVEGELRAQITRFRAADRLSRDELHDRNRPGR